MPDLPTLCKYGKLDKIKITISSYITIYNFVSVLYHGSPKGSISHTLKSMFQPILVICILFLTTETEVEPHAEYHQSVQTNIHTLVSAELNIPCVTKHSCAATTSVKGKLHCGITNS